MKTKTKKSKGIKIVAQHSGRRMRLDNVDITVEESVLWDITDRYTDKIQAITDQYHQSVDKIVTKLAEESLTTLFHPYNKVVQISMHLKETDGSSPYFHVSIVDDEFEKDDILWGSIGIKSFFISDIKGLTPDARKKLSEELNFVIEHIQAENNLENITTTK